MNNFSRNRSTPYPPDTASNENFESTIQTYDLSIGDSITIDCLTWTVIAIEGSKALILADKTVGKQHYNRKCKEVTWETCTLRKWLNEDYYDSLSAAAKNIILEVENDNPANPISGVSGGAKTKDRIFVLSLDEVNEYLPDISGRAIGDYWRTRTPGAKLRQALVFEPNGQILDDEECWVEFKYGIRPAAWIKIN